MWTTARARRRRRHISSVSPHRDHQPDRLRAEVEAVVDLVPVPAPPHDPLAVLELPLFGGQDLRLLAAPLGQREPDAYVLAGDEEAVWSELRDQRAADGRVLE